MSLLWKIRAVNNTRIVFRACYTFSQRSHYCNELSSANVGEEVSLSGWLHSSRFKGKFLLLRDARGLVQVFVPPDVQPKPLPAIDSVLRIEGAVRQRPASQINTNIESGEIEVIADSVKVLNPCDPNIPIQGKDITPASEAVRLRFRHLDLRRPELTRRLQLRSRLLLAIRRFLTERHQFCDVETPTLFARTPGGAREFVVPTRHRKQFYSLVQSPQQFKQLLMVAGLDRYMQVARCYRDEDARSDRQPEFTQIDLEMSFVTADDIQAIIEDLLLGVWPSLPDNLRSLAPSVPFPRLSYAEAIRRFGSDKPDLRFDLPLVNLSADSGPNVTAFVIPRALLGSAEVIEELAKLMSGGGGAEERVETWLSKPKSLGHGANDPSADLALRRAVDAFDEDAVVIGTNENQAKLSKAIGELRKVAGQFLHRKGLSPYRPGLHFLWVDQFPLFEQKEDGSLEPSHHPFTAPLAEDEEMLRTMPLFARGNAFDLVCNGMEVAGGSIRIHQPELQRFVLSKLLKIDQASLEHLSSALGHGCPPHGGIAIGFDRLFALLCGVTSIREVIAFPKSSDGRDVMTGAPLPLDAETRRYYDLKDTD